ncbi:hypothetical protein AN639_05775 [Candidatus Epulonipiscium fishelsonii]|nr:hypothetical protein AN639_05775 [Epulopiscium sp. SCG-B05WGA-EpuloA1]
MDCIDMIIKSTLEKVALKVPDGSEISKIRFVMNFNSEEVENITKVFTEKVLEPVIVATEECFLEAVKLRITEDEIMKEIEALMKKDLSFKAFRSDNYNLMKKLFLYNFKNSFLYNKDDDIPF